MPFEVVTADSLYGRDSHFRAELDADDLIYVLDVPVTTRVYLSKPVVGVPETPPGKLGRPFSQVQVLSDEQSVEVRSLFGHPDFTFLSSIRCSVLGGFTEPVLASGSVKV
ncbi:MAG: hypothetical protein B6243_13730 [Anaerolineaceae bacterium 4572_5.2]|nr:MAG: hypothetical protein B6243_13730 [Anaerolineaceae bacterium 4572_5.2]